jgi:hypothetical protein
MTLPESTSTRSRASAPAGTTSIVVRPVAVLQDFLERLEHQLRPEHLAGAGDTSGECCILGLGRRPADVPRQALRSTCSAPQRAACARSTFDHPPTGLSDPDAPDRLPISLDGLALCRCCESGADELGEHWAREAVDVHDCFGDTERTAGEQSECSALFAAERTFSQPHGCVRHRSIAGKPRRLGRGKSGEVRVMMSC